MSTDDLLNVLKDKLIYFYIVIACLCFYDLFATLMYLIISLFCISVYDFSNKKNL